MEIEKKYTIKQMPPDLEKYPCIHMEQGYLCTGPVVRIRRANEQFVLTYKAKTGADEEALHTRVSHEVELPLTKEAFEHLKEKIDGRMIEKDRYVIPLDEAHKAELDVFHGYLEGLRFAEIEFESVEDATTFSIPDWMDEDVSIDYRYANSYLSKIERWQ